MSEFVVNANRAHGRLFLALMILAVAIFLAWVERVQIRSDFAEHVEECRR